MSRRRAFTLIEMLVVIAVIGGLLALMLPAIQQSREAARRTQCLNNLAQIGFALQNYQMAFTCLPPGVSNPTRPVLSQPDGYHMGWIAQILPQLELRNAFERIDFRESVYSNANLAAQGQRLRVMICPSGGGTSNSYVGIHHDVEAAIDENQDGVLYLNSSVQDEDVTDGTSHTLFVAEALPGFWTYGWMSGTRSTLRNVVVDTSRMRRRPTSARYIVHGSWENVPIDPETGGPVPQYVGGLDSSHSGGLFNGLLGDGAVRAFSKSIDANVLRCLANRHDGELSADF